MAARGMELEVSVLRGRDLVAKDNSFLKRGLMGKKGTSDPYVVVCVAGKQIGRTETKRKTLSPEWETHTWRVVSVAAEGAIPVELKVYDHDTASRDDPMGVVRLDGRRRRVFGGRRCVPGWKEVRGRLHDRSL